MSDMPLTRKPEAALATFTAMGIMAITVLLWDLVRAQQALLFLIAVGLGVSMLHASFGFSSVWRNFIRERKGLGYAPNCSSSWSPPLPSFPPSARHSLICMPVPHLDL